MKNIIHLLLLSSSLVAANAAEPLTRIMFGSCIRQDKPAPILPQIVADQPELFLFLGDNIYGDTEDMNVMTAKYRQLAALPGFAELRNQSRIMATWDDHDYGKNDAGADYVKRRESQNRFLNFWGTLKGSPRRKRDGVYYARIYGPVGKRVQVIMLDTRFFRGALKRGERRTGGPYYPNPDPTAAMLGEQQWKWLAEQLRQPAELRLVGTSIQCIPEASGQETWSNLPVERQRFFDLLKSSKANGVVLLSGDRHWSEVSRLNREGQYPLYEFTSSSLNQLHQRGTPTANRFRALPATFHRENYGRLLVNWDLDDPELKVEIVDLEGNVRIRKLLFLGELEGR